MSRGIYVALSGALAQENALEATAANVANASSPGFQRLRPVFREALTQANKRDASLHYASMSETAVDTSGGAIRATGRALDVALPAGGYLAVDGGKGERYTRAGALALDDKGVLKTASGADVLAASGGPITVPTGQGEVRIDPDGSVFAGAAPVAKLKVVRFERPERLAPEGGGMLAAGEAGAAAPMNEPVTPGALEDSNAQPVQAMTELMSASRTFEAFQRVLDTLGETDRKLLTTVPGAFE